MKIIWEIIKKILFFLLAIGVGIIILYFSGDSWLKVGGYSFLIFFPYAFIYFIFIKIRVEDCSLPLRKILDFLFLIIMFLGGIPILVFLLFLWGFRNYHP